MIVMTLAALISAADPVADTRFDQWMEELTPSTVVAGEPYDRPSLQRMMAAKNVPGVQIVLIDDWQVVASRALGNAESGRPLTADTRFQAASISKSVASMAMLRLVERGVLTLDGPIGQQLVRWQLPDHDFDAPVTLKGLLSHSAGLTVHGFAGYAEAEEVPDIAAILDGRDPANNDPIFVDKRPGEGFRYSGGGYTIAQLAAEDATGKPFDVLAQGEVLEPLGMTHSSFAAPTTFGAAKIAYGHHSDGSPVPRGYNLYPEQAAASLWTTAEDLAVFMMALARAAAGDETSPISPDMARTMLTPVDEDYALGVGRESPGDTPSFGHSGSNRGFKTVMRFFPEQGDGIVVLTNGDRGAEIFGSVVSTVAHHMGWSGFSPRTLERAHLASDALAMVAGGYRAGNEVHVLMIDGDRWKLTAPDGSSEQAIPVARDRLFLPANEQTFDIVRDPDGTVTGLRFRGTLFPKVDESD